MNFHIIKLANALKLNYVDDYLFFWNSNSYLGLSWQYVLNKSILADK